VIDPLFTLPGLVKALVILVVIIALDVTHVLITATRQNMNRRKRRGAAAPGKLPDPSPNGQSCRLAETRDGLPSQVSGEPGGESGRRFLRFVFMPGRHGASRESPQEGIAPQSRLEEVRYTSCPGVGHGRTTLLRGRFVDSENRRGVEGHAALVSGGTYKGSALWAWPNQSRNRLLHKAGIKPGRRFSGSAERLL